MKLINLFIKFEYIFLMLFLITEVKEKEEINLGWICEHILMTLNICLTFILMYKIAELLGYIMFLG